MECRLTSRVIVCRNNLVTLLAFCLMCLGDRSGAQFRPGGFEGGPIR